MLQKKISEAQGLKICCIELHSCSDTIILAFFMLIASQTAFTAIRLKYKKKQVSFPDVVLNLPQDKSLSNFLLNFFLRRLYLFIFIFHDHFFYVSQIPHPRNTHQNISINLIVNSTAYAVGSKGLPRVSIQPKIFRRLKCCVIYGMLFLHNHVKMSLIKPLFFR